MKKEIFSVALLLATTGGVVTAASVDSLNVVNVKETSVAKTESSMRKDEGVTTGNDNDFFKKKKIIIDLKEVVFSATRATSKTPIAFSNLSKEEIQKVNKGKDLPYLLNMMPSVITSSDAGMGIGYTGFRVRGTDPSRINISVNDIPMNDAESNLVYFVNMPDFASSLKDIQLQRGAGTSTNGAGAFGASVNMETAAMDVNPFSTFKGSYGSFNTHKETVEFGSGLLNNHWIVNGRLSNIGTDGFIDRASVDLNSYFIQAGYFADNTSIKFINFTGKEKTYHAWDYAEEPQIAQYGRSYNPSGEYKDEEGNVKFYDNQTDNYLQKNFQLHLNHAFDNNWRMKVALHYTHGNGYYEGYKAEKSLAEFKLKPFDLNGVTINETDLVRRKEMKNDFYGTVFSVNYVSKGLTATLGGALNRYDGDHFGSVVWVKNYVGALEPNQPFYFNDAQKTDGNIYLKANYEFATNLNLYADLQYRHVDYQLNGENDDYNKNTGKMAELNVHDKFDFFNPKAGINWDIDKNNRVYASFAVAQKEPYRNCYTDGDAGKYPGAEKLLDYELGYQFANQWMNAGVNFYYMDYTDQLVLTGAVNEIGEPLTTNVKDSYRMGAEFFFALHPYKWFKWDFNTTISDNKIKNYRETVTVYDEAWNKLNPRVLEFKDVNIAFSPKAIVKNNFSFIYKGFEADLQSIFVSKQYLSNSNIEKCTLDSYFVNNLHLNYNFHPTNIFKEIGVGVSVYNLLNEKYENNGYTYNYFTPTDHVYGNGLSCQAGTHVMANLSLKF